MIVWKANREGYTKLYKKSSGRCYLCGRVLVKEWELLMKWFDWKEARMRGEEAKRPIRRTKINLNTDHIIPKSLYRIKDDPEHVKMRRGYDNRALVHANCNSKKANKILL